jgi:hypothetical protein
VKIALLLAALLLPGTVGCDRQRHSEGTVPAGAGTYDVLTDSSRVYFVVSTDAGPVVGSFERVLGAIALEEQGGRGFLVGRGALTIDLAAAALADSLQERALVEKLFRAGEGPDFGAAELRVRELHGRRFTSDLPPGATSRLTVIGQLRVQRMALSRQFQGEITRTPRGYRIMSAMPILFSISELGMEEELAAWRQATGAGPVSDTIVVTVDLRLVPRRSDQPEPAGTQPSG